MYVGVIFLYIKQGHSPVIRLLSEEITLKSDFSTF